jgi:hypothetical protein
MTPRCQYCDEEVVWSRQLGYGTFVHATSKTVDCEGVATCDVCGNDEHTPSELAECINSALADYELEVR